MPGNDLVASSDAITQYNILTLIQSNYSSSGKIDLRGREEEVEKDREGEVEEDRYIMKDKET